VADTKTTIELNGKLYDARSGNLVSLLDGTPKPKSLDGFYVKKDQPSVVEVNQPSQADRPDASHQALRQQQPAHAHQPAKSQTLMRNAVKKPAAPYANPDATNQQTSSTPTTQATSLPDELRQQRSQRASQIAQSTSISRFGAATGPKVDKKVQHLPVQPHPDLSDLPKQTTTAVNQAAAPSSSPTSSQLFADQLQTATSHQQQPVKKNKSLKNGTKIAMVSVLVLAIGGFVGFQSFPNVAVKLATSKAGFGATIPGYIPAGFGLSDSVKSAPGLVVLSYHSNSDNRSYQLTQQPSDWNSQSLLNNFVIPSGKQYQTVQNAGKTIYVYEGASATWVSNGIWYQLKGDSSLSSQQLMQIINSL
jgi:hypothetical protein